MKIYKRENVNNYERTHVNNLYSHSQVINSTSLSFSHKLPVVYAHLMSTFTIRIQDDVGNVLLNFDIKSSYMDQIQGEKNRHRHAKENHNVHWNTVITFNTSQKVKGGNQFPVSLPGEFQFIVIKTRSKSPFQMHIRWHQIYLEPFRSVSSITPNLRNLRKDRNLIFRYKLYIKNSPNTYIFWTANISLKDKILKDDYQFIYAKYGLHAAIKYFFAKHPPEIRDNIKVSWLEANQHCLNWGTHLPVFRSKEELEELLHLFKSHGIPPVQAVYVGTSEKYKVCIFLQHRDFLYSLLVTSKFCNQSLK